MITEDAKYTLTAPNARVPGLAKDFESYLKLRKGEKKFYSDYQKRRTELVREHEAQIAETLDKEFESRRRELEEHIVAPEDDIESAVKLLETTELSSFIEEARSRGYSFEKASLHYDLINHPDMRGENYVGFKLELVGPGFEIESGDARFRKEQALPYLVVSSHIGQDGYTDSLQIRAGYHQLRTTTSTGTWTYPFTLDVSELFSKVEKSIRATIS